MVDQDPLASGWVTLPVLGRVRVSEASQLALLVPIAVVVVLLVALTPSKVLSVEFTIGIGLVILATVSTFVVPWPRFARSATLVVPLLDLAAIGVLRLIPGAASVAALIVLPAMWLGVMYLWRGVAIATTATLLVLTLPSLLYYGVSLDGGSRAVLHPVVAFAAAAGMALTAQSWSAQRARLEQQGVQLEDALVSMHKNRQLTDAIVQTVDVGLLALEADGSYGWMNPQQRAYLELAFPEGHQGRAGQLGAVYGFDNETILGHDQMPSVRALNGESFSGYTIWIGADQARRRAHSASARPMFDEDGNFEGAVLAYHDVTDLMEALKVKEEFVASVSHELRTPLTSIIGYLDLAQDHEAELPDDVNNYLGIATRNAARLLMLVTDLLSTAQAEGGALRLSPRPTDLSEVVRHCLANARHRAEQACVEVLAEITDVSTLLADPDRLGQVVDNLLSNSIKYTPAGGAIHLSLEQLGDDVLLTVSDTGIGIGDQEQASLFTKFFRARGAEERAIPGVGLGLVITKAIVEAHGGSIELESAEGVGTSVRVRLSTQPA
jgi:signal transduction histidine kinase